MDHRWAEDGPVERGAAEGLLAEPFGAVVFAGGVGTGAEGGHVDQSPDAGGLGVVDEFLDGLAMQAVEGDALARAFADDADEVDHRVATVEQAGQRIIVKDAGGDEFDAGAAFGGLVHHLPGEAAGVVEGADTGAAVEQRVEDVASDEAGAAGEGDGFSCGRRRCGGHGEQ